MHKCSVRTPQRTQPIPITKTKRLMADPRGVGLQPLDFWDRGFESRWRHGCSSLVFVVCCVCSGLCDELITRSGESYRLCLYVCLIVCDLETSKMRWPSPLWLHKHTDLGAQVFVHSTDLWHQPRIANVTCAGNWRLFGITPAILLVHK